MNSQTLHRSSIAATVATRRTPPVSRMRSLVRGRRGDPAWVRPALLALLAGTAGLLLWDLSASGYANSFYAAAAQAGAESWKAFFFGSSDAGNSITVDKTPLALWPMGLSVRILGLSSWSILLPQALEGVAAVGLLYATVRRTTRSAGAGLLAGAAFDLAKKALRPANPARDDFASWTESRFGRTLYRAFFEGYTPKRATIGPADEDAVHEASVPTRLATVLPVLRGVVLGAVLGLTILIVLARLGVDIGPLLAGFGILGLAISFGSQALVRDIVSGLFFMLAEAFRGTPVRFCLISFSSDWLYPTEESKTIVHALNAVAANVRVRREKTPAG